MVYQKNILIINYAFLLFFKKFDENVKIDLNSKEDRKKLVYTVFKHSNIEWKGTWKYFIAFIDSFYMLQEDKLESGSLVKEFSKFFGYCILNWNINDINSDLAKIITILKRNFDDISTAELHEMFDDAFDVLRSIFGDEFPEYNEELLSNSILDKKRGYY